MNNNIKPAYQECKIFNRIMTQLKTYIRNAMYPSVTYIY